ncbi:ABC transporter ATP-binding protein [Neorhizobium galegae]|uniref:ABC transporter ATP-binding protein n=1 Tax=Neorhizobium galegae TaxID=399 RepID=UPI001352CE44|nr:ABC transporter ATP-binding protein [Neorhizobium galegae]KAB1115064.1 ABC transporter ATP-binding protein [Neorhizobium galegae]MCQ1774385.1 ABC transporter ATP-binding protein [Neorhizobium galegae]MCQ1798957.1 ABC transporter ATP-binding protein [Neorhizobium galegae]
MSVLSVENIIAGYSAGDQILKGVNFHVSSREIVCIVGPNGAGKSTLLKTIAGLLRPSHGRIVYNDKPISGLKPHDVSRHGIAFVPQEHNVFGNMSVYENLEMGGYIAPKNFRTRAGEVMDHFPILATKKSQLARTLSGGQRQLLAVGMALMVDPGLILLDEPTAGLSPAAAEELFQEIRKLRDSGKAIALVEQNAREAMEISDRTYILVDGKNSIEGLSEDLLANEDINRMFLGG